MNKMKNSSNRWNRLLMIFALIVIVALIYHSVNDMMKEKRGDKLKKIYVFGDYDWEIRNSSGHTDAYLLVAQLKNASINTYAFLIWHNSSDFDDLKIFLPIAEKAGIDVWAYLVPPSEAYSEPYRSDYITWSQELARLSLDHPNLKAMVIDDFDANMNFFTPDYVKEMRNASISVNSKFKFFPVIYYTAINDGTRDLYGEYIDGVIFPYRNWPENDIKNTDSESWQIRLASQRLKGKFSPATSYLISYPSSIPSKQGDFASMTQRIKLPLDAINPMLSFKVRDSYISEEDSAAKDYIFKQVLLDDKLVWEDDVVGDEDDTEVSIPLKEFMPKKIYINLTLRVYHKKGFSSFGSDVWWTNISITNTTINNSYFKDVGGWEYNENNPYWRSTFTRIKPNDLDLIVMIYAGGPGGVALENAMPTVEYLQNALVIAHNTMEEGASDGVITYCLYKGGEDANQLPYLYGGSGNRTYYDHYLLVKELYSNWSRI